MKKLAILTALLLCACMTVCAESASKTVEDMTSVTSDAAVEFITDGTNPDIEAAVEEMVSAASWNEYFGTDLTGMLGTDSITVEMTSVTLNGYEAAMEDLIVTVRFPTLYTAGETVAVLFGFPQDGSVSWTALEGTGREDGSVSVTLPASLAARLSGSTALLAVARRAA